MFTKMRLCAVAVMAFGALLFYTHQAGACHGKKGQHNSSQSSGATATQQPASLQMQAALAAKVQQTSASLASVQQTSSSAQSSVLPTLQQKQLALENALQTTLQRGNGRLTRSQLHTLGRQESAIVGQLHAVQASTIK
jgi:hypothetical protein